MPFLYLSLSLSEWFRTYNNENSIPPDSVARRKFIQNEVLIPFESMKLREFIPIYSILFLAQTELYRTYQNIIFILLESAG